MILLYTNNMINCCQSLNGLEQINADVIILDGANVETELDDLQTQINNLQTEITNGGGYFQVICERNGSHQNNVYFSFGAGSTTGNLKTYLPNCVVYGIAISSGGTITSAVDVQVIINSTTYTYSVPAGTNSVYTNYDLSISVSQGQTLQAKFGTEGSGGTDFRISLFCRTSAVNGQNVNFYEPNFTLLNANQNAYLTDTITTSNNTQNHQLHFGIPRGRSVYAYLGTVSASSNTSSVTMDSATNTNGNQEITFNFVLQTGAQGAQGPKGDRGESGSADPITIAIATSAGTIAGGIAGGVSGSSAGSASGYTAGVNGASTVLAEVEAEIEALKTQATSTNAKIQFFQEHTPTSLKTECGGSTVDLFPTNTLNLGGAVFGTGNNTNNINMFCTGGMIVNSNSTQFVNVVEMLNDLNVPNGDINVGGQLNVSEDLNCLSTILSNNIKLSNLFSFNNGIQYDSATINVIPSVNPTENNTGSMTINSQFLNIQSELILLQDDVTNPPDYPFIKFDANNFIGNNLYGSITCNTSSAPEVNNGGDFIFNCNKLTTSNDLTVNGDLQVVGNFNIDNLSIDNLLVDNELEVSVISQKGDNLVLEIGNPDIEDTELFLSSETVQIGGLNIIIGSETNNNCFLDGNNVFIGFDSACEGITFGTDNLTITTIQGQNFGVETEIINIGQAGTSTLVSLRAEEIDIGDANTNLISIGRINDYISPIKTEIGNDAGGTDIYGFPLRLLSQDIRIGDPITIGDVLSIITNTNNIGTNSTSLHPVTTTLGNDTSISNVYGQTVTIGSNNSTDIIIKTGDNIIIGDSTKHATSTSIDTQNINIGINDSGAYPSNITIGSVESQVILTGNDINIGDNDNFTDTLNIISATISLGNSNITTDIINIDNTYINIGVNDDPEFPSNIIIGSSNSITDVYGDVITIGETTESTVVNIGNTNSNIICNGPTNNITMNTTTFNSNNTTYDVEAQNINLSSDLGSSLITIGSNVNLDTSVYINTKNINIGTEQTLLTTPKLYMGTNNKTDTQIRGKTIQVLANDKTSIINSTDIDIKSSNNITLIAPTIDIGADNDTVHIQGDIIDIGTTGVFNTINIGNIFSTINISGDPTNAINVNNMFFNQIGF